MTAAREVLEEVLKDIAAFSGVQAHRLHDAESAAWEKLQPVIKAAKADQSVIQGFPAADMRALVQFLLLWLAKRKVLKNKIQECLVILLGVPAWLRVTQLPPMELQTQLLELFAANEVMSKRLVEDPAAALVEAADKPAAASPSISVDDGHDIKTNLLAGARVMREFAWTYPSPSSTGLDRDKAIGGFKRFLTGVTRLGVLAEKMPKAAAEEYAASVTEELAQLWPKVLCFLKSMRAEQRAFVNQIKFVVEKLCKFLPIFRDAAKDAQIDVSESQQGSRAPAEDANIDSSELHQRSLQGPMTELYEWRPISRGQQLLEGAVWAGRTSTDGDVYVSRNDETNEVGKLNLDDGCMHNIWCHSSGAHDHGHLLVLRSHAVQEWRPYREGDPVPEGAVWAGRTPTDGPHGVYVGRDKYGACGKIDTDNQGVCKLGKLWIHGYWLRSACREGEILVVSETSPDQPA